MPMRLLVLLIPLLVATGCGERTTDRGEDDLLLLQDHRYVVGLLPRIGGRLVVFRRRDGANALLADPAQWGEPGPEPTAEAGWRAYNGHIAWLGPQAEWWTRQSLNPKRNQRAVTWPPDPWLIYADYAVEASTPTHVVLRGPASPISGVTLTKDYRLEPAGLVITVTATNHTDRELEWNLWSNTRFDGDTTRCFAPLPTAGGDFRIDLPTDAPRTKGPVYYDVIDDCLTLRLGRDADPGTREAKAKYFLDPGAPWLAAFPPNGDCLVMHIPVPEAPPAAGQGRVEIYCSRTRNEPGLLELEHHGAYTALPPGGSMTRSETWALLPYRGSASPEAQLAFVRRHLDQEATSP